MARKWIANKYSRCTDEDVWVHQEGEIVVRVVEIGRIQLRVETDTGACLETVGLDFKSIDKYQVRALLKGNAIGFRFKDEKSKQRKFQVKFETETLAKACVAALEKHLVIRNLLADPKPPKPTPKKSRTDGKEADPEPEPSSPRTIKQRVAEDTDSPHAQSLPTNLQTPSRMMIMTPPNARPPVSQPSIRLAQPSFFEDSQMIDSQPQLQYSQPQYSQPQFSQPQFSQPQPHFSQSQFSQPQPFQPQPQYNSPHLNQHQPFDPFGHSQPQSQSQSQQVFMQPQFAVPHMMYSPYLPISPLATRSFVQVPVASPAIGFAETPRLVPETPRVERREEPGSPTLSPKPQTQKRVVDEDTQPEPVKRARKEDRDSGASEERAKEPSSLPKPSSSLSQGSKQLSKPLSQNSEEQSNPKDNDKDSQSQLDPKAAATTNTAPDHGPAVDSPSGSASPTFSQKLSALLDPTIPAQPIPEKAAAPEFDIAALLASIAKPESQKDEFARYAAMTDDELTTLIRNTVKSEAFVELCSRLEGLWLGRLVAEFF